LIIENNIITSNAGGFGIYSVEVLPTVRYNNIWNNESGNYNLVIGDQTGLNGNISVDPLFVDSENDDYHLRSNGWRWDQLRERWDWDPNSSRCIDAGIPGNLLSEELLYVPDDPEGFWSENVRVNMGVHGGTATASLGPLGWALQADITNSGIVNLTDMGIFADYWLDSGGNCVVDLNRNQSVDFNDLIIMINEWLNTTSWY